MMKRILKYKKWIGLGLIILLVVMFVRSGSNTKSKTIPVRKLTLEDRVVVKTVSASGEVKSTNQADLSFAAGHNITSILVKKGDNVKKGTLLATLDIQQELQTLQYYRDDRDKALRDRELFVRNKEEERESLGGTDQYNIALRKLDEDISQAEAQYRGQQAEMRKYYIYAPFDGTIVDIAKEVGETVAGGTKVFTLADLSKLQFEIGIDQEDYGQLKNGMTSEINLDAYPNFDFMGKVQEIPLYAGGSEFTAKVDFDTNQEKQPLLGMTGDVKIMTETTESPVKSLYYDEIYFDESDKPYVWVIDGEFISKFPIEIGLEGDIYTEVKTNVGKQIIAPLTSDIEIKDGYKARIAK